MPPHALARHLAVVTEHNPDIAEHLTAEHDECLTDEGREHVTRKAQRTARTIKRAQAPRLLAARPTRGDYTDIPALAARGEGEAVPADVLELYADDGRRRHADVRADHHAQQVARTAGRRSREAVLNIHRRGLTSTEDRRALEDLQRAIDRVERAASRAA